MSMKLMPRSMKLNMKISLAKSREGSKERLSLFNFRISDRGRARFTVLSIPVYTCRKGLRSSIMSFSTARL